LSFLQYLPNKPTKWGIKAWVLADSNTGYAWNLKIYTGKWCYSYYDIEIIIGKDNDCDPEKNLTYNVVMSLTNDLSGKGYHVFCENFYTSPALFSDLKKKGFEACGTVRMNRRGLPDSFKFLT
jgi:hypothetical protein